MTANVVRVALTPEAARDALSALDSIDGVVVSEGGKLVEFSRESLGLEPLREALFSAMYTEPHDEVAELREALAKVTRERDEIAAASSKRITPPSAEVSEMIDDCVNRTLAGEAMALSVDEARAVLTEVERLRTTVARMAVESADSDARWARALAAEQERTRIAAPDDALAAPVMLGSMAFGQPRELTNADRAALSRAKNKRARKAAERRAAKGGAR